MTIVTLMGAGGKMGQRITNNLRTHPDYDMRYVEVDESAIARMQADGIEATP